MEALIDKLQELLGNRFPGCEVNLEWGNSNCKVGGEIIWSGFDGMDQIDRQILLWSVVREALTEEEQAALTLVITFTPAEDMATAGV